MSEDNKRELGIILSSGEGTRMRADLPKALFRLCGITLVEHCIRVMRAANINKIVLVVSPKVRNSPELLDVLDDDITVVIQPKSLGTAEALLRAEASWNGFDVAVVAPADTVFPLPATIERLKERFYEDGAEMAVLTAIKRNAQGFGRIIRAETGEIVRILEENHLSATEKNIEETNVGWYCFKTPRLGEYLSKVAVNESHERYLTDLVEMVSKTSKIVSLSCDEDEALGINNQIELSMAKRTMQNRIFAKLMGNGVIIEKPESTIIDADVKIGSGTTILAGTRIEDATTIGGNCQIGPNTSIKKAHIGDEVVIENSCVRASEVGGSVSIGPFSNVHSNSMIGANVSIGSNAEIKNSRVGENTKIRHFSYLGDSFVGNNVNIGAGVVTCNYDGKDKHPTYIDNNVFVGSGAKLVAPVKLGQNCFIGAGAVVLKDVPEGQKVVGVPARSIG